VAHPSAKRVLAIREIDQRAADQEPIPQPAVPVQAYRLRKQLVIPTRGQVLTYRAGQVFFEGDPILALLRQADASALVVAEKAVVCPKCGCCHASQ
jgi:hypothetical protein